MRGERRGYGEREGGKKGEGEKMKSRHNPVWSG